MNPKLSILFLFAVFFLPLAHAEDVSVTSTFDKRSAQVGEEIHLSIRIAGAQGNIQAPRLPSFKGFDTFYTGRASHLTFINGQSSSNVEFSYVLVPKEEGQFNLTPIEVSVGSQRFATPPVQIDVTSNPNAGAPKYTSQQPVYTGNFPSSAGQSGPGAPPGSGASQPPLDPDLPPSFQPNDENIFVRAWTDKTEVYPNEQILLTYSLYTRYDTRYEGFDEEPQVSGFWIEDFPMEQDIPREPVRFNGKRYIKADIKKMALFPTAPAEYTIQPGSLKASIRQEPESTTLFDDFFNDSFFSSGGFFSRRENRLLKPAPITIHVKPFPERGKPESFQGAVGNFTMNTTVDKQTVKQNEPVTVKMVIEGQGNIETLNKPKTPELKKFKIYDADTSSQLFKTGNVIGGRKHFEIVFIPTEAGQQKIPNMEFSFFNPVTAQYVRIPTPEFNLTVTPSDQPFKLPENLNNQDAFKKDIELESKDIRYIHERLPDESADSVFEGVLRGFMIADALATILLGFAFARQRQERLFSKDSALRRRKYARSRAEGRIKKLKAHEKDAHFFDDVEKTLTQYLSDKFNLSAHGMTRFELEKHLHEMLGPGDPLFKDILELYQICDESRFAKANLPPEHRSRALQILDASMSRVEKMKR